jgi:cysteinyl-tRNA synthetase
VEPAALRLYLLSTHYRSPIEYGKDRLEEAAAALDRIRNFLAAADHATAAAHGRDIPEHLDGVDAEVVADLAHTVAEFGEALDDDFNSAGAIGKIFEAVRAGNQVLGDGGTSPHQGAILAQVARRVREMAALLAIDVDAGRSNGREVPSDVLEMVRAREDARRSRNWAVADRLRDGIRARGFVVEDRQEGPLVKAVE